MPTAPSETAPYGSWKSPITSDLIVAQITALSEVRLVGGDIYWLEGRPQEQGRNVIVRAGPDGIAADITLAVDQASHADGHPRRADGAGELLTRPQGRCWRGHDGECTPLLEESYLL